MLDPTKVTNRYLLGWMFQFLKPVKWMALVSCVYLAVGVAVEVYSARQTGKVIDRIDAISTAPKIDVHGLRAWLTSGEPSVTGLRNSVMLLAALVLAFCIVRYLREVSNTRFSMTMVYYLREAVYDKLQRVGFGFHDRISTGQLINRALSDLQNVRTFVQGSVLITLDIILTVGGYIILLMIRSPWVALLALVPLPFWTWYILRFSRKVQPTIKAQMATEDRNVSIITESIAGVHVIKAFATESQEITKYGDNCDKFLACVLKRIHLFANFQPVIRAIATASHLSLFLAAGILIIKGKLKAGDVLVLGQAMGAILGRLQQVSVINDQYQNAIVSAGRLYEILAAPQTIVVKPDAQPLKAGSGEVVFENVSFGYDPKRPVLHDISFKAAGGSVVAIVGPTGAGKSTLVQLLARFYDPQQGRILVDGMDIRDVTLDSLRTQVAFVFQETYLFSDTVAANIAYGRPKIHGGEVEAASRLAQAHEFVKDMPKGYNTRLGEGGSSLSGGQRQRLAIARAILSNPRVLVLDDATAAIDPETEDLIRRGMKVVMYDRTTFIIAHRISSVKQADLVIVIEDGHVTQMGKHDELMRQKGHYRNIAGAQLYGEQMDAEEDEMPSHMDRVRDVRRVNVAAASASAEHGSNGL